MNKLWFSITLGCASQLSLAQELNNQPSPRSDIPSSAPTAIDYNDFYVQGYGENLGWEEENLLGEELPMVLTAARLQQPKAEVPASVTVITAEQIKVWGVRTLPELMKFVPGMFVGHADHENNTSVAYHTSNPNTMRRLQVLVDGRSVYKSAIATVIWDDIGLALEDIDRIEVTRGPNAALYGANSYLGIINIKTKHPEDSQGSLVSWRKGNKGVQDVHFRHGLSFDSTSLRISGSVKADEGFDGEQAEDNKDEQRDGRKHGFINAYLNHELDSSSNLTLQMGYKSGKTEMRQIDFDQSPPDKTTTNGYVYTRWQKEFSNNHQSHLQAYWQKDDLKQSHDVCVPTLTLSRDLASLHKQNDEWANAVGALPILYRDPEPDQGLEPAALEGLVSGLRAGALDRSAVAGLGFDVTQQDLDLTQILLSQPADQQLIFDDYACGNVDTDLAEQRVDIEWQDTLRWNDELRTVSGLSFRQDSAYSRTYFNGHVNNNTWRAFLNAEYRATRWLIFNAGGMYEYETYNDAEFSPKIAANFLIDSQQSIRLVASQAVRSPDLLETQPEYIVTLNDLTDNYLGVNQADFYQQNIAGENEKSLKPERITSYEVGYFVAGDFKGVTSEFDIKFFREELRDMISDPMTLQATYISNENEADVKGVEFQLLSRINYNHSILANYMYSDVDSRYVGNRLDEKQIRRVEKLEERLSSTESTMLSWMYNSANWSASLSYFNQDRDRISYPYERFQLSVSKPFVIAGLNAEVSYYIQHNRQPDSPLTYKNQKHSTPNLFYGQLAIEF